MSITMSSRGREQQINRLPAAGGSSGSGSYFTDPEINPVSQVWQTPVRHDHRTGTSHASASSSRLRNSDRQRTFNPLRANETRGPVPSGPARVWGGGGSEGATPGVIGGAEPKISVWMRLAETPQPVRPA